MSLYSNGSIPYHSCLDDRKFEEFIRDLYLQDINDGHFGNKFDEITILSGVREQGRDCVLHKNHHNVGVIQCKLYNRPLNKPESVREIVKFCLYSILNSEFIFNKNEFEYHFVSSCGFNDAAHLFLKDFRSLITKEDRLDNWIEEVIRKNKSLDQIKCDDIKNQLLDILCCIEIIPITGNELDRRLAYEHNNNLYSKYFEVKNVVDQTMLSPIRESLEEINIKLSDSVDCPLEELKNASFSLYLAKDYFGNIKDSYIERKEKAELLNWINSPNNLSQKEGYNNILFLSGSAGCGKTTLLRCLYDTLQTSNIPVLGLKADSLIAVSLEDLRIKINFTHPIVKSLSELSKHHNKIVLLIDQIDALSQYLSANRDYINTYIQLIESLKDNENIKTIVSVREYDLNYDFSLYPYKDLHRIDLGILQDQEVESVLLKMGLAKAHLSQILFDLLKNPNNLDVFCRIYNTGSNIHDINTLQDLYLELWKQLSQERFVDKERLTSLLYNIVEFQSQQQRISISRYSIEDKYPIEYNFLNSKGIIIEGKDNSIHFFHQSFYDYVFARKFVEKEKNVIKYLTDNNQSFLVRSGLKMILSYISFLDRENYITTVEYILKYRTIKKHIKLLTISLLANIENPLEDEMEIVTKIVIPNPSYYLIFLDNVISTGWIIWLINNGFLHKLYQLTPNKTDRFFKTNQNKISNYLLNTVFFKNHILYEKRLNLFLNITTYLLRRNLKSNEDCILNFIFTIDFPKKNAVVGNILYSLKNWNNPLAYRLFSSYKSSLDTFTYRKILEDMIPFNIEFVINEMRDNILDSILEKRKEHDDWSDKKKILDLMNKTNPNKSVEFLWNIVLDSIKRQEHLWTTPEDILLVPDGLFGMFSVEHDRDYRTGKEQIYARLIKWIKNIHVSDPNYFDEIIKANFDSKYQSIVRIVICVLDKYEYQYEEIVISIIDRFYQIGFIIEHGELQGDLFRLIKQWFPYLKKENQKHILCAILSLCNQGKVQRFERNGVKTIYSSFGLATHLFLQSIPNEYINSDKNAKKIYQELNRKFPTEKYSDYLYGSRCRSGGIASPINSKAYNKMTNKQWLKSFLKYNEDKVRYDFIGGREQHARRLEEEIKIRPNDFVDLFDEMLTNDKIHEVYIALSFYAFSESPISNDVLNHIYENAVTKRKFSDESCFYIVLGLKKAFSRGIENDVLIKYVCDLAISYDNPKTRNDRDLYTSAINSVRGSSIEALYYLNMEKYGKIVMDTIQKIVTNANEEILASVIVHIAYLNQFDTGKAFQIFLSIIENASDELFIWSFSSVQYYVHHDFFRLEAYLNRARNIQNETFRKNISAMLYFAWVRNYPKADLFLFKHIENDMTCIAEVIHYAITNFYFENDIRGEKALFILNKYLYLNNEQIAHQYDCCFLHYKKSHVTFESLYPFIIKYIRSNSFNSRKYYVLEYLIEQSTNYPDKCLSIFKRMKINEYRKQSENEFTSTIKEKQIQLLMGFYNCQSHRDKKYKKNIKFLDSIFNQLVTDLSYKVYIDKALDMIQK